MKTVKEKMAEAIKAELYECGDNEALRAAQAALDIVCDELQTTDMQNELWNLSDEEGFYLLAGKRGIRTYYPKLLLKAAADKLRG